MFQETPQGAAASTDGPATESLPQFETVRHLLFGSPGAVQATIKHLHGLGYADPNDWSRLLATGRPNEVMAILTKKVRL